MKFGSELWTELVEKKSVPGNINGFGREGNGYVAGLPSANGVATETYSFAIRIHP